MTAPFRAKSAVMREKQELIERFAASFTPALVSGEAGTGKRFLIKDTLRRVHPGLPLTELRCAFLNGPALTPGFSGALLLNEISALPLERQEPLLASLKTLPKDTPVFSTTKEDIESAVKAGSLRKDLAARLGVLQVYIPPLRQRPEDIRPLALYFLKRYGRLCGRKSGGFSAGAMELLTNSRWQGNVRELKNAVEYACIKISAQKTPGEKLVIRERDIRLAAGAEEIKADIDVHATLKDALDSFKRMFIKKALDEHNGNRSVTARSLDIQRTYLCALIKSLEIEKNV